jgi:beta-galactosidase
MRILNFVVSFLLIFSASSAQKKPLENESSRIEKLINSQWTFNYISGTATNKAWEAPGFDDSKWPVVSIPHTWSTYETTGELHPFIRNASESDNPYWWTGWGWYRKHFLVKSEYSDRKIFIEFEGVQKYCKIWLNGKYLGDHKGGYGSFDFDITSAVKYGEDNVLAVAVNNRQKDEFKIPPMATVDFNVYGGIYRDVRLVLKDKLYIPMQGSASHEGGTCITTPEVSEKEGIVRVQTWVKNENLQKISATLQTTIADSTGKIVQLIKSVEEIVPGGLHRFDQTFKAIKNPQLWSVEKPYLYTVISQVMDGKRVTDTYKSPLGFRWFRWDYKENFLYLNGKKVEIHGGNRHQDFPWLGDAIPKWITLMDIRDLAENLNYNFLRTAHYPNDKFVYDLTDKFGVLAAEELPNIGNQEFSPEVQEQQLKEMIRRDRNHPSIIFWSLGNETDHAVNSKYAIVEDTTRILTSRKVTLESAGSYVRLGEGNLTVEDLFRCTIRGWYNKDVKDMEPADGTQSGTEEHQQIMLKASKKFGNGNLSVWIYGDHGSGQEYVNSPLRHVSPAGYVDLYRIPKYSYYFWQANFSKKPMVFIQPHNWRSQYLGMAKDIVVNTNCDKVELLVNGVSKGFKLIDQSNFHSVTFNSIPVEAGTITALGTKDGKTIKSELMLPGRATKIILTGSQGKISADRSSLVIIRADIVDLKGNHVYGANNTIRWSVSGPATLAGPLVYESDINKRQMADGAGYIDMPVSNIIRSTGKTGIIRVTVSASGLTSGSCDIEAVEMISDNSVIVEPQLRDEGRSIVSKMIVVPGKSDEIPREIKETTDEVNLGHSDKQGYEQSIREYLFKSNSAVDTTTIEFKTLTELLASRLSDTDGRISADEFNYSVNHFNNCRQVSGYVNFTKLPPLFKDGLKKYYSDMIIRKGSEKNGDEEMNWLNWIPSGGTVVIVADEIPGSGLKGTIYTTKSALEDIISVVYPQFAKFSPEARERALVFTSKANPFIHVNNVNGQEITYTAEKGKPILVPLLKFISE